MASVEQVDCGIRQIELERLRTRGDERGIVPPPRPPKSGACAQQPGLLRCRLTAPGPFRRIQRGRPGGDVRFVPASTAPGQRRCVWPNVSDGKAVVDLRQTGLGPGPLVGFPKTGRGQDMMTSCLKWLMVAGVTAVFAAAAARAENIDAGKAEFQSSCASCHGADGKGKGPVSEQLKVAPADLTILAKKNNGVFPTNAVYETIYGSKTISAHGTREMPIWGDRFNPTMNYPHIIDPTYDALDPSKGLRDVVVRTRILAIVDYLSRIQQK